MEIMVWWVIVGLLNAFTDMHSINDAMLYDEQINTFLETFIRYISAPKRLIAFHCRKKAGMMAYSKYYTSQHIQVAFIHISKGIPDYMLKFEHVNFLVKLECNGSQEIINRALEHNMFRKSNVWIFRGNINDVPDKFYSKYNRVFVMNTVNETKMEVYKIFRITQFSPKMIVELFQIWSLVNNTMIYYKDLSGTITNLMKEPIRVSYAFLSDNSFRHLTDYRAPQEDQAAKIVYLLMEQICILFNATHRPIMRKHWGTFNKATRSYTPQNMFADLQTGIADISGNTAAINEERLQSFRFLPQTGMVNLNKLKWFFVAPSLSSTENIWVLPFVSDVWISIFFVLIIWYIALALVISFEVKMKKYNSMNERNCFVAALDILVTSFTQRASYITLTTYTGMMTCYSLYIFGMLIYVAYTAHFLVLLHSTTNKLQRFEDLLDKNMALGSDSVSYNIYYFSNPSDLVDESIRQKIYNHALKNSKRFWLNASQGINLVKQGGYAFHIASTVGYVEVAKQFDEATKRSLRTLDSVIEFLTYLCVPNNSPLEDFLSYGFQYIHETGITKREQAHLFPQKPSPDYTIAVFSSLDYNSLLFVFWIFTIGLALSLSILIFEIILFKSQ